MTTIRQDVPRTSAPGTAQPGAQQPPKLMPPGVVPPPAAPTYTPLAPQRPSDPIGAVTDTVRRAREAAEQAQQAIREGVRGAVDRARTTAGAVLGQPAQQPVSAAPTAAQRCAPDPRRPFDPAGRAQYGLLNLAWRWQEAGAPIRAIHAYMELLQRYPDTPAAAAAIADLVELSEKLIAEGQFHTAFGIYEHLEQLEQLA